MSSNDDLSSNTDLRHLEVPRNQKHVKREESSRTLRRRVKQKQLPEYTSDHYDQLPLQGRETTHIRILNLIASSFDNPQIECELITPQKAKSGEAEPKPEEYEALSWCWGTENQSKHITIRKGRTTFAKYVSPNLFSALRALRHHRDNRYLWVDAICIDQGHLDEKNHQVEMMDKIYGTAKQVCIWLGDADRSSRIALKFIQDDVLKLQDFDDLCESPKAAKKWRALLDLMQRPWFSRRWVVQEIALARSAMIYCGTDMIPWNQFAVAVELFVEVETATHRLSEVMKKDPQYYHIPGWFEYVSALGASLLVDATGRLFRNYKNEQPLDERPREDPEDFKSDMDYSSDSDNHQDDKLESLNNGEQGLAVSKRETQGVAQPVLGLEYLVASMSIFDTSMPHDTIYALLAIAKDTTPIAAEVSPAKSSEHAQEALETFTQRKRYNVDYKLPYVDVCKEFIQFCIERSLEADKSRGLDVICRPWATKQKVLDQRHDAAKKENERQVKKAQLEERRNRRIERTKNSKRNSRASDGSRASTHSENMAHRPMDPGQPQVAAPEKTGVTALSTNISLPSWVPQLSGAPFAMARQAGIAGIKMSRKNADPLVGLPGATQINYSAAESKEVDIETLKFRKRTEMGHYSMYVKGFMLDTIDEVEQISRNGQIPQEWAELSGWTDADSDSPSDPPDVFWRTLVADRGKDGRNPPVYYARACKESFKKGGTGGGAVNTIDLINYERNSVVAQFCRRVQAVVWNRALIKTRAGRLGLVGKNVKKDDKVCILYGCSVPVILRENTCKGDEKFDSEMEWELGFLKSIIWTNFKRYRTRAKAHKTKKEEDKEEFFQWDRSKWRQWRKDEDWHTTWNQNMDNEKQHGVAGQPYSLAERAHNLLHEPEEDLLYDTKEGIQLKWRKHLSDPSFNAWKKAKRKAEDIENQRRSDLQHQREQDKNTPPNEIDIQIKPASDWRCSTVNWHEFEIELRFFRKWKNIIRKRKEDLRAKIEQGVMERIVQRWGERRFLDNEGGRRKGPQPPPSPETAPKPIDDEVIANLCVRGAMTRFRPATNLTVEFFSLGNQAVDGRLGNREPRGVEPSQTCDPNGTQLSSGQDQAATTVVFTRPVSDRQINGMYSHQDSHSGVKTPSHTLQSTPTGSKRPTKLRVKNRGSPQGFPQRTKHPDDFELKASLSDAIPSNHEKPLNTEIKLLTLSGQGDGPEGIKKIGVSAGVIFPDHPDGPTGTTLEREKVATNAVLPPVKNEPIDPRLYSLGQEQSAPHLGRDSGEELPEDASIKNGNEAKKVTLYVREEAKVEEPAEREKPSGEQKAQVCRQEWLAETKKRLREERKWTALDRLTRIEEIGAEAVEKAFWKEKRAISSEAKIVQEKPVPTKDERARGKRREVADYARS